MKSQPAVSLLSMVAASALLLAPPVQAEPIIQKQVSVQQVQHEPIETLQWVERHGCTSEEYKRGEYKRCEERAKVAVSPVRKTTSQDDMRNALTNLFDVRFGFGSGLFYEQSSEADVEWVPANRVELHRIALQAERATQVLRQQDGFSLQ